MPTFEIGLPDGRKMRAEAANEAEALQGAQAWWAQQQPPGSAPAAGSRAAAEDQRPPVAPRRPGDEYGVMDWTETAARPEVADVPVADFADKVGQGFFLQYGDELAADLGALPNILTGGRYGKPRQQILDEFRAREKRFEREHPAAATVGETGGALGSSALGGIGATRLLGAALGILRGAGIGAASSAPFGAIEETGRLEGDATAGDYGRAAGKGAMVSGGIGALVGGGGNALARVAGPWATDAAQWLAERGVRLTPGELVGGLPQRAEDALQSMPFLGTMVRNRRAEGVESMNRAAFDEALAPMRNQGRGARMPDDIEPGHSLHQEAEAIFNRRYGTVVPRMTAQADAPFRNEVAQISTALPQTIRPQFADAFRRHVIDNMDQTTGGLTGRALQDSLQGLRTEALRLRRNPGHAYDIDLANSLEEMRDALEASAGRYTPTRTMNDFRNINRSYRRAAILRDAGSRVGAEEGVFSPAQLHNAVRTADQSTGKGAMARGTAAMQDFSDRTRRVMRQRLGDSGSPERAAFMALLAAPGAVVAPQATLGAAGTLGGIGLLYSRPGNRTFQTMATFSPQTRAAIRRAIERTGIGGAPAAAELMGD